MIKNILLAQKNILFEICKQCDAQPNNVENDEENSSSSSCPQNEQSKF